MDTRKPDIFDRLMHLPVLNIFEPFYKKHKAVSYTHLRAHET